MEVWGGNQATDNGVIMPGLDAWVVSRPYKGDDAGGDIHYVSSCNTGRITRILVADVSGHGQTVAKIAIALRTLMRRYVNYIDQSRLVRGLNTEFAALSELGSFATAIVATFWAPTDNLVISNAGHPRPIWYRARTRAWELVDTRTGSEGLANIPLGIAEPTSYDEVSIRLSAGDLVLIYTDSLMEAKGPDGKQLGEAGMVRVLNGLSVAQPDRLIPALLDAIEAGAGAAPADDVTALLLRPNALKPRIGFVPGIKAGVEILKASVGALRRGGAIPWPQIRLDNLAGAFFSGLNNKVGRGKGRD